MCSEVAEVGEIYVYIEHGLSPPIMGNASDIEAHLAGGDDGEDADNEKEDEKEEEEVSDGELGPEENNDDEVGNDENRESESEYENGNAGEEHVNERDGQPSEDEAEIVGDGAVDARFKNLFASAEEEAMTVYDTTHVCGRGQGRPPVRRQPSIPRGVGIYTCPFTNRVFDVRGSRARDLGQSQGPRQL
ncbi:hypothetical protein F2Q70_00016333 [Brassica cretica]|uniref:Uncharacterized protein n=1 Tax=Brassica cretica TaxID=69181 RepID=A0A8S9HQ52_BRACR|nr:hypothetical protein F2Q70_00016333 [Brassica cretica]KAF2601066.1 hypothetical protein F2Q68_00009303 [Brassica cretica]